MNLFRFFQPAASAPIARERLQIVLGAELGGLVVGRKGKQTRFELAEENARAFINGADATSQWTDDVDDGSGAEETPTSNHEPAHMWSCQGKGRKQRITPLTLGLVSTMRIWLAERGGPPGAHLFVVRSGKALSRDALEHRLAKYVQMAGGICPTLMQKSVTMHVLRHSAAMRLLHAGIDTSVIALWLGHENVETTQAYLHADLAIKERALARTRPAETQPGRFRPADKLLAFLEAL
jgi:hypothetical protein